MKKQLYITNETGFYLPYVLIVAIITLSMITTSILVYKNELESTHLLMEQLEVETLIQMGRAQFKKEKMYKRNDEGQLMYEFPNGTVIIDYVRMNEQMVSLQLDVKTTNDFTFIVENNMYVDG